MKIDKVKASEVKVSNFYWIQCVAHKYEWENVEFGMAFFIIQGYYKIMLGV